MFEILDLGSRSSENKGADQLRGYREADLCLCFRICKALGFSRRGSFAYFLAQLTEAHLPISWLN